MPSPEPLAILLQYLGFRPLKTHLEPDGKLPGRPPGSKDSYDRKEFRRARLNLWAEAMRERYGTPDRYEAEAVQERFQPLTPEEIKGLLRGESAERECMLEAIRYSKPRGRPLGSKDSYDRRPILPRAKRERKPTPRKPAWERRRAEYLARKR